jgi:site-specific DNA-cytosine methylase
MKDLIESIRQMYQPRTEATMMKNSGEVVHNCAKHVEHAQYGKGNTIAEEHADPDRYGNIAWYDVMFEHGIEKGVPVAELSILQSESHGHSTKKAKKMAEEEDLSNAKKNGKMKDDDEEEDDDEHEMEDDDKDKPKLKLAPKHRWITAGEATQDLANQNTSQLSLSAQTDLLWQNTQQGETLAIGSQKVAGKRSRFNEYRLSEETPSNALSAQWQNFYHWAEPRRLTYLEYKRLGSFPDDYYAKKDSIGKYMIGMSVPPKMTEAVARAVIEQWL